jgi:hypothetical protein
MMNKKMRLIFQILVGIVMVAFAFGGIVQAILLIV